ncbi:hypothetical protein JVU11DRAFT_8748 [Chiua virens]|nr:hypothetical protein JVU11DRAFT_8748 [Chiua virens]
MERYQVHTKDVLAKLHATLAPIKRVPPEVLSEIFEWCLDARDPRMHPSMSTSNKVAPLLLGRVCRMWRAVAHATPHLWQDVSINVCDTRYSDELRSDALPVLQTWLAHSGGLLLNLVVLCKTDRVLPGLVELFETIDAHGTRWKTVHFLLQNSPVIFKLVCRTFVNYVQPLRFDLSSSPLRHLSLSLAGLTIRDVHASWASLTRLCFMQDARASTTSITDYVAVLRQCTSLKECGLSIGSGVRDAPLEPLTLPNLECLQFQLLREASHTTQIGDFLSALYVPQLRALAIQDYCPRREVISYHSQLRAFLRANAQSLRHLRFSVNSKLFTSEDMIALIMETPLLTELEYHPDENSSPKALLRALTPRIQGDVVDCALPNLERLFVYWDTSETVSMVGDMIEQRYALVERGIARLRHLSCKPVKVSIVYDCMPTHLLVENLAARLEALCRCGLQVDWEAYRYDLEFLYC